MSRTQPQKDEVLPEQVLKGVLNTLMSSSAKSTLTPIRRSVPTSAFSTPSRSVSSAYEYDDPYDDDESSFQEDFQLQYPSPIQPHLEIESAAKPNRRILVADGTSPSEKEASTVSNNSNSNNESPRSALDGVSLQAPKNSQSAEHRILESSTWRPDDNNSAQDSASLVTKEEESSPQRSHESSIAADLASFLSRSPPRTAQTTPESYPDVPLASALFPRSASPVLEKSVSPVLEGLLPKFSGKTSLVTPQHSSTHYEVRESPQSVEAENPDRPFSRNAVNASPRSIEHTATLKSEHSSPQSRTSQVQSSPERTERTPPQTPGSKSEHSQQDSVSQSSPNAESPSTQTSHPKELSMQLPPVASTSTPGQFHAKSSSRSVTSLFNPANESFSVATPADESFQSGHPVNEMFARRNDTNTFAACSASDRLPDYHLTPDRSTPDRSVSQDSAATPPGAVPSAGLLTQANNARTTLTTIPDEESHSPEDRPSRQLSAFESTIQYSPTASAQSTPERSRPPSSQPSPSNSSFGSLSTKQFDRMSKPPNHLGKKIRARGEVEEGIPPRPPGGLPLGGLPPPPPSNVSVSPSDNTPLVSNQQRKSIVSEEKKEVEDWPGSAVKQMSQAVDKLRVFGESFIYDDIPPSKNPKSESSSRVSEANSGMSDISRQCWQKEETFHTDGDELDVSALAQEILNKSSGTPQRREGNSGACSRASPSPPPAIQRTPTHSNIAKPIAMELTRTADLILQPDMSESSSPPELDSLWKDEFGQTRTPKATQSVEPSVGPSIGPLSVDPSSVDSRAMTPMMRMRVPGAQESVLMGENEALPVAADDASQTKTPTHEVTKASSSRHGVEFAVEPTEKKALSPDRSRRSKSSRSSKGRSHGSSTRRSRASRRSRGRRKQKSIFSGLPTHCEGGLPQVLQSLIDRQCGQFLDEEDEVSESTYWSGESGDDESDGDTYGESLKSDARSPPRKTRTLETLNSSQSRDTDWSSKKEIPVETAHPKEKEVTQERERLAKERLDTGRLQQERTEKDNVDKERKSIEWKENEHIVSKDEREKESVEQANKQPTPEEERSEERVKRRQTDASNIRNKNFIREFISELSLDGIKLLHHRRSHRQSITQPAEVTGLLRLGTESGTKGFCEPCLQFLAHDGIPLVSVDLFDVRALEKASALQLQSYPLAVPGNSLLIRTNPGDFVFEAEREDDAVRIVHGMRWLIARLSFNLIIGNTNVSCELLDVGQKAYKQRVGESNRAKAMNDLANHLVDKSSIFSP